MKQAESRNSFNSISWPDLYTQEHGHPMLKRRHMEFTITEYERDAWLENMYTAIQYANFLQVLVSIYLKDYA